MKLNISFPGTGQMKSFEFDDEKKLRIFYEKRLAQEVEVDALGDEWKGYVVRIAGGNDKQGFPMKQGVLTNGRVRLLLAKGQSCYRIRKAGERKRKSVRGCIVDANLSALALVVVKKGDADIEGLTDKAVPRRLGPKRASKIRKLFNLTKEDDVRKYVLRRKVEKEGKKPRTIAPKIQRLITPQVLQRKRHRLSQKKARDTKRREEAALYQKLITKYSKDQKAEKIARRRSSASHSQSEAAAKPAAASKKAAQPVKKAAQPTIAKKGAAPAKAAAPAAQKKAAAPAKPAASKPAGKAAPKKK